MRHLRQTPIFRALSLSHMPALPGTSGTEAQFAKQANPPFYLMPSRASNFPCQFMPLGTR